jgi:hypothetical protein
MRINVVNLFNRILPSPPAGLGIFIQFSLRSGYLSTLGCSISPLVGCQNSPHSTLAAADGQDAFASITNNEGFNIHFFPLRRVFVAHIELLISHSN